MPEMVWLNQEKTENLSAPGSRHFRIEPDHLRDLRDLRHPRASGQSAAPPSVADFAPALARTTGESRGVGA